MNIKQWMEREKEHIVTARRNTTSEQYHAVLDGKSILWNQLRRDLESGNINL